MSGVFFAGDGHFGQKGVSNFRKRFDSDLEHNAFIIENWFSTIGKRDTVYCLGDWVFDKKSLSIMAALPGRKILLPGNHDKLRAREYLDVFDDIIGIRSYKGLAWLTHCPMHPQELYGKFNLHGHIHRNTIQDVRYVNVCMENIGYTPITLEDIMEWRAHGNPSVPVGVFNTNAPESERV
jgi:calcineurin-like phosphoesterase family protein